MWAPPGPGVRPAAAMLAANERRRAPDSVLMALEVAHAALVQSGRPAAEVATVFASTHGDLATTDAMCKTLAADPRLLSPTRFHHSVHNAASGYWAIASGSRAASTALAAGDATFATGLLEALSLCQAEQQAVMLVAYDTEATGPLTSVNSSRGLLSVALVLAPQAQWRDPAAKTWALRWSVSPGTPCMPAAPAARALATNAMACALPLCEALAACERAELAWPLSSSLSLQLSVEPLAAAGAGTAAA